MRFSELPINTPGSSDYVVGVSATNVDARFPVSSISTRQILTANTTFYVAVSGSDSNPGTAAKPWATIQHAMDHVANFIDGGGFNVFVSIGAGSFVGFGSKLTVGINILQFYGAGSGLTTIINGPNDGVFNFGECITFEVYTPALIGINRVTIKPTNNQGVAVYVTGLNPQILDVTFTQSPDIVFDFTNCNGNFFGMDNQAPSFISFVTINVIGGGGTISAFSRVRGNGLTQSFGSVSISGSLTVNDALVLALNMGNLIIADSTTWTGSGVVGKRFRLGANANIADINAVAGTLGPTFFPGTVPGTGDGTCSYDGSVI